MAILSADQLCDIRREVSHSGNISINYTKADINKALQGIENWFENNQASLATAIDTATNPFKFTDTQKRELVKHWLAQKFKRGG